MKPLNILIIEDNQGDQEYIEEILKQNQGMNFKGVNTLQAGIEELTKVDYDVILLDLFLPDVHGDPLKAFFELKNYCDSKDKKETAIVILTGLSDDDVSLWAIRSGAQDFFVKGELNLHNKGLIMTILRAYERALHIKSELDRIQPNLSPPASTSLDDSILALKEIKKRLRDGNRLE